MQRGRTGQGWAGPGSRGRQGPHLLAFLDPQLPTDLDALYGVGEELSGGILHLVLVEGAREVPTQENDSIGHQLGVSRGRVQHSAWPTPRPNSTSHTLRPAPLAAGREMGARMGAGPLESL